VGDPAKRFSVSNVGSVAGTDVAKVSWVGDTTGVGGLAGGRVAIGRSPGVEVGDDVSRTKGVFVGQAMGKGDLVGCGD